MTKFRFQMTGISLEFSMDSVSQEKRSGIMRLVKGRDTSLEKALRSRLWKQGLRYRKNASSLFGKPDISFTSKKIVIFIDSCFWHGCSEHLRMPKSNLDYWTNKIEKNRKRDQAVNMYYRNNGWKILRVWEHRIKNNAQFIAVCRRSKWSKYVTNSPFLALRAMAGSSAACKISSACSNALY
jgi:DNA mismatch endonuclease (patch repair protein)